MKTTLIEHNNELYLVSDEEKGVGFFFNNQINSFLASTQKSSPKGLIIPSDLMDVFKGVDVDYTQWNFKGSVSYLTNIEKEIAKYFYAKALQDNKDKRFTESDLRDSLLQGITASKSHLPRCKNVENIIEDILASYKQKKGWKVEIKTWTNGNWESYCEEKRQCVNCFETNLKSEPYNCKCGLKPKLTKNSEGKECYTITKITH